jgi:hypothetical protein
MSWFTGHEELPPHFLDIGLSQSQSLSNPFSIPSQCTFLIPSCTHQPQRLPPLLQQHTVLVMVHVNMLSSY